jgi:hypothetical protein
MPPANGLKFREFLLIQAGDGRIVEFDDSNRPGFWSDKGLQNIQVYGPSFRIIVPKICFLSRFYDIAKKMALTGLNFYSEKLRGT